MKFLSSLILFLSCFLITQGQTDPILPVDERGKLIYYEVVNTSTAKELLVKRAIVYTKEQNKDLKYKSAKGDTSIIATGKMVINKTVLVMSHPSGEILYNLQIEVKEGKYRFWLTDFNFIPYQRDRYGNFVAVSSIGIPLEKEPGKLNVAQWAAYQSQTAKYAMQLATDLKKYMANEAPTTLPKEKTVVKKEW